MIGQLKGILIEKRPPQLLLDVGGVGYEVEAPMTVFYDLPEAGGELLLHTHFVVREDAQLLFGFASRYERELFRSLIKVNGVGPKMALAILSGIEADRLAACIRDQDTTSLVKVPGIGKKTAERLVIEMSDRLDKLEGGPARLPGPVVLDGAPDARADAIAALEALGYRNKEAAAAVGRAADDGEAGSEELIRRALRTLAR
ncbi:Holliday junction branch migration protein RuvA [Alloalcanivorax sp. C16-2]|uniref:Holliday junction branch migration protein RuvA n=1 Tax=Alloalcanivorax TaxID=3020832 RepID=UPI0019333371|nr:Holliday junction branch migration protein RuvA [Alloalcanivorax marinus]MBL7250006.1 Holliday junction branch migration protein RuvA [Alloalcanivorax marinus]